MAKKKKSTSSQKKEEKQIKKYYGKKEERAQKEADVKRQREKEDIDRILADAGIAKNRAMEDYFRNKSALDQNKSADIEDINNYVKNTRTRTEQDVNTSLANELRRFSVEQDKINTQLAESGLTFSERKPEQQAIAETRAQQQAYRTNAERSFQDVARYEYAKTRDIENKYGQDVAALETGKTRTLENIMSDTAKAQQQSQRNLEDITTNLDTTLEDIGYQKTGALTSTKNWWDEWRQKQSNTQEDLTFKGQ